MLKKSKKNYHESIIQSSPPATQGLVALVALPHPDNRVREHAQHAVHSKRKVAVYSTITNIPKAMTETEKNHVVALGLVCGDAMERAFDIYLKGEKSEFVGQFKKAYNDLQRSIKATKYYASIFNEMIIGGYIAKTKCGFQCFDDLREDADALIRFKLRADNLADLGVTNDAIENSLKIMQYGRMKGAQDVPISEEVIEKFRIIKPK